MMRHAGTFGWSWLGCADVESTVELRGIASDHFAGKFFCQEDAERGLSGGGWADNRNQRRKRGRIAHRKKMCQARARRITRTIAASSTLPKTLYTASFPSL